MIRYSRFLKATDAHGFRRTHSAAAGRMPADINAAQRAALIVTGKICGIPVAQGVSLGNRCVKSFSPGGATETIAEILSPLWGWNKILSFFPGLTPWATIFGADDLPNAGLTLYHGTEFKLILEVDMQTLKIGELAFAAGVHIETLRFYERKGLLDATQRTPKGYRLYSEDIVARVRFIKRAQRLGFSLKEVGELLRLKLDHKSKCADVEKKTKAKIEEINHKIESLLKMKSVLEDLAKCCRGARPSNECAILKAFENPISRKQL